METDNFQCLCLYVCLSVYRCICACGVWNPMNIFCTTLNFSIRHSAWWCIFYTYRTFIQYFGRHISMTWLGKLRLCIIIVCVSRYTCIYLYNILFTWKVFDAKYSFLWLSMGLIKLFSVIFAVLSVMHHR